uniref:Midgut cysteine proteinase 5 n=1 Tax=Rhipicephalus appendiculatus TaxID=34631 RepID=Q86GZ2_RHIAP|nr:midgut cysteine proteinase 5 [Rhipicephalus appendiculatus]
MLRLSLLCAIVAVTVAANSQEILRTQWEALKTTHITSYQSNMEELLRFKIFTENSLIIAKHNAKYAKGLVSYKLGMNQFGDLLAHEFAKIFNGYHGKAHNRRIDLPATSNINDSSCQVCRLAQERSCHTRQDQGQCGSCWAFSATGSLEGQHLLKDGELVSLSEQNLVDCSQSFGNNGCEGGLMDNAFNYIKANDGIDTEEGYPYEAVDGECRFKKEDVGATDTGFVDIPGGIEDDLKKASFCWPPPWLWRSPSSFQLYSEGVYDESDCSSEQLDHGVLVVGYGVKGGKKYWLVKNSWAESWGDQGYILMSRDKNNQCGIASAASYPLV